MNSETQTGDIEAHKSTTTTTLSSHQPQPSSRQQQQVSDIIHGDTQENISQRNNNNNNIHSHNEIESHDTQTKKRPRSAENEDEDEQQQDQEETESADESTSTTMPTNNRNKNGNRRRRQHNNKKQKNSESTNNNNGNDNVNDMPNKVANNNGGGKSNGQSLSSSSSTTNTTVVSPLPKIRRLKLEAIFHPKFDNEKASNSDIRTAILRRVAAKKGYIEVSLKHSGSLALWSGNSNPHVGGDSGDAATTTTDTTAPKVPVADRFYSKNASSNKFTYVACVLLQQWLARAWYKEDNTDGGSINKSGSATATTTPSSSQDAYNRLAEYLSTNRLTLAMEVVTSRMLGDHGQSPLRDFVVVTAIADRKSGTFLSTAQVLKVCQRFKLPHNDIWCAFTPQTVTDIFKVYDESREVGLATSTQAALSKAADTCIQSPCPHTVFQGEILEGFIIRYVPFLNNDNMTTTTGESHSPSTQTTTSSSTPSNANATQSELQHLATVATNIVTSQNPPDRPMSFELYSQKKKHNGRTNSTAIPNVWKTDLRVLFQEAEDQVDRRKFDGNDGRRQQLISELFDSKVKSLLLTSGQPEGKSVGKLTHAKGNARNDSGNKKIDLPSLTKHLLSDNDDTVDTETRRIARLLQRLDSINGRVYYNLLGGGSSSNGRHVCIIHVIQDQTFFKYQTIVQNEQQEKQGLKGENTFDEMPLYRGFCVELLTEEDHKNAKEKPSAAVPQMMDLDDQTEKNDQDQMDVDDPVSQLAYVDDGIDDKTLMLKMKLLPYMIRTFICRNHLGLLRREGMDRFLEIASSTLGKKWGLSQQCCDTWMPYFEGWANYVLNYDEIEATGSGTDDNNLRTRFGPLRDSNYLQHLEYFTAQYKKNVGTNTMGGYSTKRSTTVDGLFVCIVGQSLVEAELIAQRYAADLSPSSSSAISVVSLEKAVRVGRSRSCIVYTTAANDDRDSQNKQDRKKKKKKAAGPNPYNFLNQKVCANSVIICYGSSEQDILDFCRQNPVGQTAMGGAATNGDSSSHEPSNGQLQKMSNVWKAWKEVYPCFKRIMLDRSSISWSTNEKKIVNVSDKYTSTLEDIRSSQKDVMEILRKQEEELSNPANMNVLVFFPGITGCGKSSLVKAVNNDSIGINTKDMSSSAESTNRRLIVKEGDVVGKKFWDVVTKDLSSASPSNLVSRNQQQAGKPVLFVADKNVPPPSWPRVAQILGSTNTLPLFVVPDDECLQTTTVTGSMSRDGSFDENVSHFYPFSLKYLAVCMLRVLNRPPNTHPGKLDSSTEEACMVVVQFFTFYKYITSDTFVASLRSKIATGSDDGGAAVSYEIPPIRVPFLTMNVDGKNGVKLPSDLEQVLREAIQLRHGYDAKRVKKRDPNDKQMPAMEARLRECLKKHQPLIESMSVPLEESQQSFTSQLKQRLASLKDMKSSSNAVVNGGIIDKEFETTTLRNIKLVSLDVDRASVENILNVCCEKDPSVKESLSSLLKQIGGTSPMDDKVFDFTTSKEFVSLTHVTMGVTVGAGQNQLQSAKNLYDKFHQLQGCHVEVSVKGLLWSSTNAALEVDIAPYTSAKSSQGQGKDVEAGGVSGQPAAVPACENEFAHITCWVKAGAQAVMSNELPKLLVEENAKRVDFKTVDGQANNPPLPKLVGTLSFWNHNNQVMNI